MDSALFTTVWETTQTSFAWDIGLFVHIATFGYVLGFLFKNQLILRFLALAATFSYIVYYYYFPAEPLWGAIFGSVLIGIAIVTGTIRLLRDQIPVNIPPEHLKIFNNLKGLTPGEYRRLMKTAETRTAGQQLTLTVEGKPSDYLYFILEGTCTATKGDEIFTIESNQFVGETSFILNSDASATVTMAKGGMYTKWEQATLLETLEKRPALKYAFEALIGRDLAQKVSISHPIARNQDSTNDSPVHSPTRSITLIPASAS